MNFHSTSQLVREALAAGNIRKANALLGTEYFVTGKVIHGDHLVTKLGFPTANLLLCKETSLFLPFGIYVVYVPLHGKILNGLTSIGVRPTVDGKNLRIEVHLFDFRENLYNLILSVYFIDRLRDEMKFNTLEELSHQMQRDKEMALQLLLRRNKQDTNP